MTQNKWAKNVEYEEKVKLEINRECDGSKERAGQSP